MCCTRADRSQLAAELAFVREGDGLVVAREARSMRKILTSEDSLEARWTGLQSLQENIAG
jgi:hypothetical protein